MYDIKEVRFLTSGMKRTDETLSLLFGDVPYETEPGFREINFASLKCTATIWLEGNNETNVPPQGESGAQMKMRVLNAFADLREDTCVITHGGVIAAIMEHLFPEEGKNRYQWQPKPGGGYAISDGMCYSKL